MKIKKSVLAMILTSIFIPLKAPVFAQPQVFFPPVPAENKQTGKNSNAYSCAIKHPTTSEKLAFLDEIKPMAKQLAKQHILPASALVGMSALESCFGFTRTGVYANNYFGIKKWTSSADNSYQLIGQPDEDRGKVRILKRLPTGELIFDEINRKDNRYRIFSSKGEALTYLVDNILLKKGGEYITVTNTYRTRIKQGTAAKQASRDFLCELAAAGYNHLGCNYYRTAVGKMIDQFGLDALDQ
jgi:hypothetical protein